MKERYPQIDDKNEALRNVVAETKQKGQEFLERFEMSWVYHDSALEGVVYSAAELGAALRPGTVTAEASMVPVILEIRNHRAAIDFIRAEAKAHPRKHLALSMDLVKKLHDILSGNTPEAMAARTASERREKTEKELAKERERAGFRKDMPLHRTYFHDIAQPAKIQPLLEKLIEQTGSSELKELHPIRQAATVQYQLIQIFPFNDHSGKVGRLLSNLYLMRHGYFPCIIHSIDRQKYYEAFRGGVGGFRVLLSEAMENSLDNALKHFRDLTRRYKAIN